MKGYKVKESAKGKACCTKCGRNQVQTFNSPLLMESQRMGLIPSAASCDNTCEVMSTRKLIRDSVLKVSIGLLMTKTFSVQQAPKF